jgi:hypothetical protein
MKLGIRCALLALLLIPACGDSDGDGGGDGDGVATHVVTGTVVDFETGEPVAGSATVSTDGLEPPPSISVEGADFVIEGVPPFSVFHILGGSPPSYRATYSVATEIGDSDIDGLIAAVVSEDYLLGLAEAFEVGAATSVLLARLVDDAGDPIAGIASSAFDLGPGVAGPFFLDAELAPDPAASETSASGYVVVFDVPVGLYSIAAAEGSGYSMIMPESPSAATAATLANVTVSEGESPELPTNVSFSADITPIFELRGCVGCHDGGGIGKDLGGLHLNGAAEKMYSELVTEISENYGVTRVDTANPEQSLMLTMPSREDPPDAHPNVTFASPSDPDYLMILAWISEGALKN